MTIKLGSLFDGSGGFPLAGTLHGIEPVWASEIEPFPIRVTKARFPNMKHLGSVTDVNGAEVEPVDIITFGSPCQDLSVAGKQLGIHDGERSNLFFEAIRIIKEMRNATAGKFPQFAVWENVPGAFSSNKGFDFRAVIEAFCEITEGAEHIVPMPPKNKWLPAGCVVGDGWSVAWRVYDAQFWGVPQRRKRIYLIADFASERAGEILFECESVRGDSAESGEAREGTAADAQGSAGRSDCAIGCDLYNGQMTGDKAATLGANSGASANHAGPSVCYKTDNVKCLNPWDCQSKRQYSVDGVYRTLDAGNCAGGQSHGICYPAAFMGGQGAKARSIAYCEDGSTPTLKSTLSGGNTVPDVVYPINTMVATRGGKDDMRTCFGVGEANSPQFTISAAHEHGVCYAVEGNTVDRTSNKNGKGYCEDVSPTLNTIDRHAVAYGVDCRNATLDEEKTHTIQAKANGGISLNCTPSVVYDARGNGDGQIVPTLTDDHQNRVTDYTSLTVARCQSMSEYVINDTASTLKARDYKGSTTDVIIEQRPPRKYIVRRLTPTECARLQGFPDWWTNGADGSDSAKYKLWGNGIALPCAEDVIGRIAKTIRRRNDNA